MNYPAYFRSYVRRSFQPDEPIILSFTHTHGVSSVEITVEQASNICDQLSGLIQDIERSGYYGNQSDDKGNNVSVEGVT